MSPSHAIILLAHGSRDPLWRRPVEAVQARLQAAQPDAVVRCAYLELCPPTLHDVVQELATQGIRRIAVVPLFLGAGRHVREDLPLTVEALARAHPALQLRLAPHVGEDERLLQLMADIAAEAAIDQ
ncbi:sirohydrochlorin cobaltochelatase [Oryzisolibacter propanilivorax]|uniref:Sirohydrochlorin cobaltochelatase n=1 Tax=Oryzisolibacter propanilivorax TaxID=1527607 RepID=A0A1G9PBX2_9BURK|nr:CbiX/SirB N-terminal domain-containing protein [Oryzisolibacter propanilivorax]SDL96270.1 sirohydrochlorin cobaltochelatase [Oryzisolibacter propanilivorax]